MPNDPVPTLSPEIQRWIVQMFQLLKFGNPLVTPNQDAPLDSGGLNAGELRQQFQLRLDKLPIPREGAPKEVAVLENFRRSLEEAIAKAPGPDDLMKLEPRVTEYEHSAQALQQAADLRRERANALNGRLKLHEKALSDAVATGTSLDEAVSRHLSACPRIAMLLTPPWSDESLAEAQKQIDAPRSELASAFEREMTLTLDSDVPQDTRNLLDGTRKSLQSAAGSGDLGQLVAVLPGLANLILQITQANTEAANARQVRVEKARELTQQFQNLPVIKGLDEDEKQRLDTLNLELPKLSTVNPPIEAINAFEEKLGKLVDARRILTEVVEKRGLEAQEQVMLLGKAEIEPDIAEEIRQRLAQTTEDMKKLLAPVPAAKDLPDLKEKVRVHIEEITKENLGITERRGKLELALGLLKLDAEMPQTEQTDLRGALTKGVEGAKKRPADPSLKDLEDGLEALAKKVEEANKAFDERRKMAADLREKLSKAETPKEGEPGARVAIETEIKRIQKLLEEVPTRETIDQESGPIEVVLKKIEEMAKWVTQEKAKLDTAVRAVLKDTTWPGFSGTQGGAFKKRLDEEINKAAELWKLGEIIPRMEDIAKDARALRAAAEPLVRRLGLLPLPASTGALKDEEKEWSDLRLKAKGLIEAMADPGAATTPAAVLTTLEKLLGTLTARIAVRATAIPGKNAGEMANLAAALGGSGPLNRLVDAVPKAQLDKILQVFAGSEAALGAFVKDALGGDPAMLDGMLRLACDGNPAKLKTLIDKFPGPPASENLGRMIVTGGLNGRPDVLAAILKTGCADNPDKLVAFVDEMKDPEDLRKFGGLLGDGGFGGSPQALAEMIKLKGNASLVKSMGIRFDDPAKLARLGNLTRNGGLGDGPGQDPRTLAAMLDGPKAMTLERLEEMTVTFDGAGAEKLKTMLAAFNAPLDPAKPPVAAKRMQNLVDVFRTKQPPPMLNPNPNAINNIRDTFYGNVATMNSGASAVSGAGRGIEAGTGAAAKGNIAGIDPGLMQARLTAGLPDAEASRIAANAPGLPPADRDRIADAQALMTHLGTDGEALRNNVDAKAQAEAAAKERAKAIYTGEGEVPQSQVTDAINAANKAAEDATKAANDLRDVLLAKDAVLTPADIAEAAGRIGDAVAAAKLASDDVIRTGAIDAAKALRAALDGVMKRHAARLLATAAAGGAAEALKAGVAAEEAMRAMVAAGGASPAVVAALKEAAEAARGAGLAAAGADAVENDLNARNNASAAAARAATGLTGASPPDPLEVTKAETAANDRARAARDAAKVLAGALAAAKPPPDPGLLARTSAAAAAASRAAAEAVDDAVRGETIKAAKDAAKAVSEAAARLAVQADTAAALNNPGSADALKAGFGAKGALEALRGKPGVTPQEILDLQTAIEAGDRAALMLAQADRLAADPNAQDRAQAVAVQTAETTKGGPASPVERDAAMLNANNAADLAAQTAVNETQALILLGGAPTAAQIKATQDAADAALKAAGLCPDNAKRADAIAKAKLAMAAVATALHTLATSTNATVRTATQNDTRDRTGVAVAEQNNIAVRVQSAITYTANNYAAAHYTGTPLTQAAAQNNIKQQRLNYTGDRQTKVNRMDEAKEAAGKAATTVLREIADTHTAARDAALAAAKARSLADMPGSTPEQQRDAAIAERTLAKEIADKARTDAQNEINVTLVSPPSGGAGMPAPTNPFVSAAAPVDGLMKAAISLKAAVAAATERVDAAARAFKAATETWRKKNDVPTRNAKNSAETAVTTAMNALKAMKTPADTLAAKAAANVKTRATERANANGLPQEPPHQVWKFGIIAQCQTDLDKTREVASMAALIVAQSFSGNGANLACAKGLDALLEEAAKFALTPLSAPPPDAPGVNLPTGKADMVHFNDRHALEHCSFDPETVYYPDEMEDIIMFGMRKSDVLVGHLTQPEVKMREMAKFAKVNGFWPEGTTEAAMANYLQNALDHVAGIGPINGTATLINYMLANNVMNASLPGQLKHFPPPQPAAILGNVATVTVNVPPLTAPIQAKLSGTKRGHTIDFGQFFPLGQPLTAFFDMASIKKSLGK